MPFDDQGSTKYLTRRIETERELGRRSFHDFYTMAWPFMDPAPYVEGKHIRVICYHLQRAARREVRKILVCIPPRYSKSLICSVAFPAWVWTWWPSAKFITCSYDQKLGARDSLATRRLVEHPWYRERWPEVRLERDQHQKMWYQTTAGGVRYVGSPSTGVTGHGADFALFDDPHDVVAGESEADRVRAVTFWFESMSSRFNDPSEGVSIVIGQRVHQNDVQGECVRRGYDTVVLPARYEPDHPELNIYDWRRTPGEPLWPEKFDDDVLIGLWQTLRDYAVAGQQQQRPTPREGGLFKRVVRGRGPAAGRYRVGARLGSRRHQKERQGGPGLDCGCEDRPPPSYGGDLHRLGGAAARGPGWGAGTHQGGGAAGWAAHQDRPAAGPGPGRQVPGSGLRHPGAGGLSGASLPAIGHQDGPRRSVRGTVPSW